MGREHWGRELPICIVSRIVSLLGEIESLIFKWSVRVSADPPRWLSGETHLVCLGGRIALHSMFLRALEIRAE